METDLLRDPSYKFQFSQGVLAQMETQARRRLYAKRPDLWAKDVLDVTMWSRQREVALSVVDNHNTMVAAGHGIGKSMNAAVIGLWWIDTHPIGEARLLTTAPTTAQVRGILWREMQLLHRRAAERYKQYKDAKAAGESTVSLPDHPLPGYITSSGTWRNFDGLELGSGRTPPRGREGDAFQGIHGGVLAIADEGVGVSKDMIDTLRNNTTADEDRILILANPTNPLSEMGQIWNDPVRSTAWSRITISVLDSPHFTDEGKELPDSVMKYMTNKNYVEEKILEYGEDSANYKARVLGQWALDSGMILFPEEVVQAGLDATVIPDPEAPVHVGFDVARSEKGDHSYLYSAQEGWVYRTHEWREGEEGWNTYELPEPVKTDKRGIRVRYLDRWRGLPFHPIHNERGQRTVEVAANERTHVHMKEFGGRYLKVDADGMGALMVDAMYDVADGSYEIFRMVGGNPSSDRNAWYNSRAEWYSRLADRMRRGEVDIEADTDEHPLAKQLGAIEYKFAAGSAESILILSKREMKSKGIKSPDAADAAVYASAPIDVDSLEGPQPGDRFDIDIEMYATESVYSDSNSFFS